MKKKLALIIIYLAIHFNALGDVGRTYCMEAVITLKNGVIHKGYFGLSAYSFIEKEGDTYKYFGSNRSPMLLRPSPLTDSQRLNILETDFHFHNYVRNTFMYPTILLYSKMTLIYVKDSQDSQNVSAYLGSPIKLLQTEIEDVIISNVYWCGSSGRSFLTEFELSDSLWLKNEPQTFDIKLEKSDLCGYKVLNYQERTAKTKRLIEVLTRLYNSFSETRSDLSKDHNEDFILIQKKIDAVIEELRKEKAIVVRFCSC
jgi:hypothetical protein